MKSFLNKLILSSITIFALGFFPFLSWGYDYWFEFACSFIISISNSLIGYYLAISFISESDSKFYTMVYGGMLVRMAFLLGFILFMILNNHVNAIPFFLSLMLFYVIHQWIEISGWLKELPQRKVQLKS
tara:strand:+ start:266 stop:652 length:387 start_codon:yes stop_codon:yes gene_type:complete